jgi:hypothetical protein
MLACSLVCEIWLASPLTVTWEEHILASTTSGNTSVLKQLFLVIEVTLVLRTTSKREEPKGWD